MASGSVEPLCLFSRSAFRQHERSRSVPSLPQLPLPVITATSPPPHSPLSSTPGDAGRPPTPHRGYSLAVPAAVPPGASTFRNESTSKGRSRAFSHGSMAATRGSQRGSDDEIEEEGGKPVREEGGLRDVRSRETMRSRRTRGASPAPTAASASPIDFHDSVQIYQIVAGRRANFDLLLWSVPSTSFAAQAFLFQTALAGDSSRTARIVAMALSVLITLLTLQLFTRQLQAEAADHAWLEDWEKRHGVDAVDCAHGETWATYRSVLPHRARHFKFLASIRGFTLWSNGMLIIGLVAIGVLITAAIDETAFQNCQDN